MRVSASPLTRSALTLLLPLLVACEPDEGRQGTLVRDSAGIAIVENAYPLAAPLRSLSGPVLTIGAVAGEEEYALHDVTGVVRMSDGSIVVATAGSQLRWFDPEGRFLRAGGGEGEGPGEFRRIRYVRAMPGDSLLVFDSDNRRVSVLAPDGTYVRGETIGVGEDRPSTVAGALRDGTLLTRTVLDPPPTSTPLYRVGMEFAVSGSDGVVSLGPYPGPEAALHADGSGGGIGSVFISVLPFARSAYATAGPDRFFVGSSDAYQIDAWDGAGRLVRVIRVAAPPRPVTEDVWQAYIGRELESIRQSAEARGQPFEAAAARRELSEQSHAPALPAFGGLLATAEGGLWVKDYAAPGDEPGPERWAIFDPEGEVGAVVDVPPGFTPMHVDGERVLGVFRDDLDVPYVHAYTIG